ncbi:hypothetical protein RHA65_05035 [Providencia rettgeri]|nr:hypothetical protein [Providencia rettgeri]
MTDKTGGAAFPVPATELHGTHTGMTLRDYFAAKAMQGDLASQSVSLGHFSNDASEESLVNRANFYYRMADAMLKARGWYGI